MMESLLKDIRYAARSLVRHPGFAIVAVATLALGIGVNTALFTVFNVLVLKPLPITDPDSVVQITGVNEDGQTLNNFSYLEYLDYRDRNKTLSALALVNKVAMPLGEARLGRDDFSPLRDEYVYGQIVSADYFSMLGAQMGLGGVLISRLLAAVLVDLNPLDPIAFGSVSVFLAVVGLLSCWLPARRATKVHPLVALRYE